MSTDSGTTAIAAIAVSDAKAQLAAEQAAEAQQLDLLAPPTPEEMLRARLELGDDASGLDVLDRVRSGRVGRPKGSRNKRTDDFARYILSFGQDPAITLMQIASTPPEVLIEASKQPKVHSFRPDGTPNMVIERMSYEAAQSLRKQCAAELMSFIHAKRPIAVDMNFSGVRDLVIGGVTHTADEVQDYLEAEFMDVPEEETDQ